MKNNIRFFLGVLVGIIISGVTAYAITIVGSDVSYDNTNSGLTSTNVQGAVDELYNLAGNSYINVKDNYGKIVLGRGSYYSTPIQVHDIDDVNNISIVAEYGSIIFADRTMNVNYPDGFVVIAADGTYSLESAYSTPVTVNDGDIVILSGNVRYSISY